MIILFSQLPIISDDERLERNNIAFNGDEMDTLFYVNSSIDLGIELCFKNVHDIKLDN